MKAHTAMEYIKIDRTSFLIKLLVGSLTCLIGPVFASDFQSFLCEPSADKKSHCRASVRHIEGGGIGYNQGYTTLEGFFAPDPEKLNLIPFLDFRGHIFDDGYLAANGGIGLRKAMGRRIYGINSYYDARNTHSVFYNQVGLGFETLGKLWDFRINGYLPVGKRSSAVGDAQFKQFSGHEMLLSQSYQFAMKGVDTELGFPFVLSKSKWVDFYAAAGPYYYVGELGSSTYGGKIRLKGQVGRYVSLEASNSYDPMFHNNFQVQLTLTLPLEKESSKTQAPTYGQVYNDFSTSRMVEPVGREEIIVSGEENQSSVAIDPATGQPYHFVFVNNTSHSAGTFESPYPTLALAQENSKTRDIIYVFPGDGTTNGMDSGITLKPNQKFWGSGIKQQIQTTEGNIIVPAFSSMAPQMTNSAGNGITLATNNQISGVTIKDVIGGSGIFGIDPQNVQIYSSTIDNSEIDQIHLEYGQSGSVDFNNLTLSHDQFDAVFIQSTGPSFTGSVKNSTFQYNRKFINASFTGDTTFSFMNNTMDGNDSSEFNFQGQSSLFISGNKISNSTSQNAQPFNIIANLSPLSATLKNNIFDHNDTGAIHFILNNTNAATLAVTNNTFTNNGSGLVSPLVGGVVWVDPNNSTLGNTQLVLADNIISGNSGYAIVNHQGSFNDLKVTATNNLINNNGGNFTFDIAANSVTLIAKNNTITNGGDSAIVTSGGNTIDTFNIILSNNQITGNGNSGLSVHHGGETVNLIARDNNISENNGTGILFYSSSLIDTVNVIIDSNNISGNLNQNTDPGGGGIDLEQFNHLSATITNNTTIDNAGYGVYISSSQDFSSVCLALNGNNSNFNGTGLGYLLRNDEAFSPGTFNLAPLDVDTVNIGEITSFGVTLIQACPS